MLDPHECSVAHKQLRSLLWPISFLESTHRAVAISGQVHNGAPAGEVVDPKVGSSAACRFSKACTKRLNNRAVHILI